MYGNYQMFSTREDYNAYLKRIERERKRMEKTLYKKSPLDILKECGQEERIPVDLVSILREYNISCIGIDFSTAENMLPKEYKGKEILGALVTENGNTTILYSNKYKKDSHRVRFTIAHELAHCCLNGDERHIEFRIDGNLTESEIAANTFAGELLIPENSLRLALDTLIVPSIEILALLFDVSSRVMKKRVKYLHLEDKIMKL